MQKLVQSIEILKLGDDIRVMRVNMENGERIIGLPMYASHKSSEHMSSLDITMLYVPQQQTVMNIIDLELTEGSLCVLEPCGKQCFQPEMQFFWNEYKDKIVESFNRDSHDGI